MGLFDDMLGSVVGGLTNSQTTSGGGNQLMHAALGMIQQQGGLPAVIEKFRQGGFAQEAESWIGKGQNLPISADTIQSVLGSGSVGKIAAQLGLPPDQVNSALAKLLPQVIDKMTPSGSVGGNHEQLLQQGLAALTAALGNKPAS